jgi:hypothetical protein
MNWTKQGIAAKRGKTTITTRESAAFLVAKQSSDSRILGDVSPRALSRDCGREPA